MLKQAGSTRYGKLMIMELIYSSIIYLGKSKSTIQYYMRKKNIIPAMVKCSNYVKSFGISGLVGRCIENGLDIDTFGIIYLSLVEIGSTDLPNISRPVAFLALTNQTLLEKRIKIQ